MSYVEEADELRAELAVCRETNRRRRERDAANVAKLQAIRALCARDIERGYNPVLFAEDIFTILDGGDAA